MKEMDATDATGKGTLSGRFSRACRMSSGFDGISDWELEILARPALISSTSYLEAHGT